MYGIACMFIATVLIVAGFATTGPLSFLACFWGGFLFMHGILNKENPF